MWFIILIGCPSTPEEACLEEQKIEVWVDSDGDGFGGGAPARSCDLPINHVTGGGDCDDGDPDVHPDVIAELCNGVDDDCNGEVDEGWPTTTYFTDADGDGFGTSFPAMDRCGTPGPGWAANEEDCDDTNPEIHPDAVEVCNAGIDDDCDFLADDDDDSVDRLTYTLFYADADADGYGDPTTFDAACAPPAGSVTDATDCDDTDPGMNPGMVEACTNRDDDCDGLIDDVDPSVDPATQMDVWIDTDSDGYGDPDQMSKGCRSVVGVAVDNPSDCDDTSDAIHPGATDICNGGVDDDCSPITDEDVVSGLPWYDDPDGDGYGIAGTEIPSCTPVVGRADSLGDCDEGNADIHPAAPEVCGDGLDSNCDGDDCIVCNEIVLGFPKQWVKSDSVFLAWQDLQSVALTIGDCSLVTIDLPNVFTQSDLQNAGIDALWMGDSAVAVEYTPIRKQVMRTFAAQGGGIVFSFLVHYNGMDNSDLVDLVGVDPAGIVTGSTSSQSNVEVLDALHPLADQLPNRFPLVNASDVQQVQGDDWGPWLLPDASIVMASNDGKNVVVAYDNGTWRGVLFSGFPENNLVDYEGLVALYNAAHWASGY